MKIKVSKIKQLIAEAYIEGYKTGMDAEKCDREDRDVPSRIEYLADNCSTREKFSSALEIFALTEDDLEGI